MREDITFRDLAATFLTLHIGNTTSALLVSAPDTPSDLTLPTQTSGAPAIVCRLTREGTDAITVRIKPYAGTAPANTNLTVLNSNRPILVYTGGATTLRIHRDIGGGGIIVYATALDNL